MKRYMLLLTIALMTLPMARVHAQTTASSLTINQLLNATVPNFVEEGSPMVALINGQANQTNVNTPQYYINLDTDNSSYTNGDFLNTGVSDIAAVITYNGGGSGTFYYLELFINNGGIPQYLTATELGDRMQLNSVSYSNGIFSVDMVTQCRSHLTS